MPQAPAPAGPDAAPAPSVDASPAAAAEVLDAAPAIVRAPLTAAERAELFDLLDRAERAMDDDHLTYPSSGSALALYDQAALLDPDNDEVRRGLERIVERYLELALSAAEQRRFSNADALLDRARLVDPRHPGIEPAAQQARLLASAKRREIALDSGAIRRQDPTLSARLREAGSASRDDGCRAVITAASDADGRWIYQQMSNAPGDTRIRAHLEIGAPPRVVVLCFPDRQ